MGIADENRRIQDLHLMREAMGDNNELFTIVMMAHPHDSNDSISS